jgi:hypothetical protein
LPAPDWRHWCRYQDILGNLENQATSEEIVGDQAFQNLFPEPRVVKQSHRQIDRYRHLNTVLVILILLIENRLFHQRINVSKQNSSPLTGLIIGWKWKLYSSRSAAWRT